MTRQPQNKYGALGQASWVLLGSASTPSPPLPWPNHCPWQQKGTGWKLRTGCRARAGPGRPSPSMGKRFTKPGVKSLTACARKPTPHQGLTQGAKNNELLNTSRLKLTLAHLMHSSLKIMHQTDWMRISQPEKDSLNEKGNTEKVCRWFCRLKNKSED